MSGWTVCETVDGDVHVCPTVTRGRATVIVHRHRLIRGCWCQPVVVRDGPLDEPLWGHRDPDWPGAAPERVQ